MKLPSFLSLRRMAAAEIVFNALAIYWFMLLQTYFGGDRAATSAAHFLLLPAMALVYWVTASKLKEVVRAAAVLRQLRTPDSVWRQMVWRALRYTGLVWLFVAVGSSVQMALPASGVPALAGAALMSLAGLVALGRSVSPAPRLVDLALALVGVSLLLGAPGDVFAWFGNQPVPLLVVIALAFPACLLALGRRWWHAAPRLALQGPPRARSMTSLLRAQLSRYTIIDWNKGEPGPATTAWASPEKLWFITIPVVILMANPVPLYVNEQLQLPHAAVLFVIPMFLFANLIIRDLHWRTMLLPGGLHGGKLGFDLWRWTLVAQCIVVLMLAVLVMLTCRFALELPWSAIGAIMARYVTLPVELAFATALAVTLRPLPYPSLWAALMLPSGVVALFVAHEAFARHETTPFLGLPLYVGGMAAATVCLIMAANKLWTYKKLRCGR